MTYSTAPGDHAWLPSEGISHRNRTRSPCIKALAPRFVVTIVQLVAILLVTPNLLTSCDAVPRFVPGNHTSNAAVIVSSSRYWFNYRHVANALSIYRLLRSNGAADERIILMLADDIPTNARNPFKGKVFPRTADGGNGYDLMAEDAEIDYAGTDVTVDNFLRVLTGRHHPGEASSRTLPLDENTNFFVFLTGHGGDRFFKFQDAEELTAEDIASTFRQMHAANRYREILFVADTCQAFTLADDVRAPRVRSVGTSLKDQNSYARHADAEVGLSVIDRYTHALVEYLSGLRRPLDTVSVYDALVIGVGGRNNLGADVGWTDGTTVVDGGGKAMTEVPLTDFLAAPEEGWTSIGTRARPLRQSIGWENDDDDGRGQHRSASRDGDVVGLGPAQRDNKSQGQRYNGRRDNNVTRDSGEGRRPSQDGKGKATGRRKGMRPSGPGAVLSLAVLVLSVRASSRLW